MKRETANSHHALRSSLELPCGAILRNRLAQSPMSDSLGDGEGNPTEAQIRLYERWAEGGIALSIIGEVQGDPRFPEKPGNLVLGAHSNQEMLRSLASRTVNKGAHLWPQLGHAGHGFLLSQFLSPLFNHRKDGYGGSIEARSRIVVEIISKVRRAVGPSFPVGIRINATDQMEGGLTNADALEVVRMLDQTTVDLIDISGGAYFPGAKASSEGSGQGPYFIEFAQRAKGVTNVPLMLTGGFKRRDEAIDAIASGAAGMVGLGRAVALNPRLANAWLSEKGGDPEFPKFEVAPPGGITAWYTMRLTALGEDRESAHKQDLPSAIREYEERDAQRCIKWKETFSHLDT